MKNINWKVRVQKKSFWVAIVSALIVFINSVGNALGYDLIPFTESFETIVMAVLNVLVLMGVVEDMTTGGVTDSEQALTYQKPKANLKQEAKGGGSPQ